jgi:hypothetical protein
MDRDHKARRTGGCAPHARGIDQVVTRTLVLVACAWLLASNPATNVIAWIGFGFACVGALLPPER